MIRAVKEKRERALGIKLGLKAERCDSPKCALTRKPYRPGMHGHKRAAPLSDFGKQLREKQKFKITYGISEKTLRRLFNLAQKSKSATGEELLRLLERRLDNVVFKLGFARSRRSARQLVSHGHILVNEKRVTSPGYLVERGDVIAIHSSSQKLTHINKVFSSLPKDFAPPSWLFLDREKKEGKVVSLPEGEDLATPFEVSLLIESFSK